MFLFITEESCIVEIHYHLFTHSPADGNLGCLHFGAIKKAVIKICAQIFYRHIFPFILDKEISWNGISGSYSKCIFHILRSCQTGFQMDPAIQFWVFFMHSEVKSFIKYILFKDFLPFCALSFQ